MCAMWKHNEKGVKLAEVSRQINNAPLASDHTATKFPKLAMLVMTPESSHQMNGVFAILQAASEGSPADCGGGCECCQC